MIKTYMCDLRTPATCTVQNITQDTKECIMDKSATLEIKLCPYRYETIVWQPKQRNNI